MSPKKKNTYQQSEIANSLSYIAFLYPRPDHYASALRYVRSFISSQYKKGGLKISYTFNQDDDGMPIEADSSLSRSALDRLLIKYKADIGGKRKNNNEDLDAFKHMIFDEALSINYLQGVTIEDLEKLMKFILEDIKGRTSATANYLTSLGFDLKNKESVSFTDYLYQYKKTYFDSTPSVEDPQVKATFKKTAESIFNFFDITFEEGTGTPLIIINIKKNLDSLQYYSPNLMNLFEDCKNPLPQSLLFHGHYGQTLHPTVIRVNHELLNAESLLIKNALYNEIWTHEILHALGATHPDENLLDAHYAYDKSVCTIMEASSDERYVQSTFFKTMGPTDILALEALGYSINSKAFEGDNTYNLAVNSTIPEMVEISTLLDRSGLNTLDTSDYIGKKTVKLNIAYGCYMPSVVGNQKYFLDYKSKFSALKLGNSPHYINDSSGHDLMITMGTGKTEFNINTLIGTKTIVNFDKSKHKIKANKKIIYAHEDQSSNCYGKIVGNEEFSVEIVGLTCLEAGLSKTFEIWSEL